MTAALDAGRMRLDELVHILLESPELTEAVLLQKLFAESISVGRPVDPGPPGVGPGTSERVLEVPWAMSRYRGERRVLDVGYANAPSMYLRLLLGLGIPDLHGVDIAERPIPRMGRASADVRQLPYRSASFPLTWCSVFRPGAAPLE